MVVLSASPPQSFEDTFLRWFDSLVDRSLHAQASPAEFLDKFSAGIAANHCSAAATTNNAVLFAAARLPLLGRQCSANYGQSVHGNGVAKPPQVSGFDHHYHHQHNAPRLSSPFRWSLRFLHAMAFRDVSAGDAPPPVVVTHNQLQPEEYLDILTNFDCCWSSLDEVQAVAEQLEHFVHQEIGSGASPCARPAPPGDCLRHCVFAFRVLDWHVGALCELAKQNKCSKVPPLLRLSLRLISAIRRLRSVPFPSLLIFLFFSQISDKAASDGQMLRMMDRLSECVAHLKNDDDEDANKREELHRGDNQTADDNEAMELAEEHHEEEEGDGGQRQSESPLLTDCVRELTQLVHTFPDFATPPPTNCWAPFRENFLHRRHRPAILTLASVYAIYRVLKSADEVADAFLTVSQVLGISHEQMVEDLLRAGFLIQLETVSSSVDCDRREREALADVFVFFKLPLVLIKMLSRGVPRASLTAALGHLCASASLLDALDAKKSDNMFRFFMDALHRAEIVCQRDYDTLMFRRNSERSQNEELVQLLTSTMVGISSSATTVAEAVQTVKVRSQLIDRVEKAKIGIDRLNQTVAKGTGRVEPEMTGEMLRKLIPHEVPIDVLCAIHSASGELSTFSGWLAALNAQTQLVVTNEGVDAVASSAQGRLLIFDSTFLLMARIQAVFPDLRLEELVGARVHCTFFLWNQRYANCVERGEPMTMPAAGGILRDGTVIDEDFYAHFRANQFSAMRDHKTPFWSAEHSDFGTVLELVPLVGELLLDELHQQQQHQQGSSPRADEMEAVNNVLSTFRHLSSLWLCLVQWLDTQPTLAENSAKQFLARAMREFEIGWQKKQPTASEKHNGHERLGYSMFLARRTLKQLAEARVKKEHPYTWLIGFAQRPLPALPVRKLSMLRTDKDELKEERQRLKETSYQFTFPVFLCANQQGWASPDAVAHVNRCNVSLGMDIWLQCWLGQMLNQTRIATVDEGELAGELCLATAFTYPVPCLCEMIKQLVECVLFVPSIAGPPPPPPSSSCINIDNPSSTTRSSSTTTATTAPSSTVPTSQQQLQTPAGSGGSYVQLQQKRHPIVGDLSPKATVMAKMLVRALQLLLWAGERSVLGKREREKRLQQIYGTDSKQTLTMGGGGDGSGRKRRHQSAQSAPGAADVGDAAVGGAEPAASGLKQRTAATAAGDGQIAEIVVQQKQQQHESQQQLLQSSSVASSSSVFPPPPSTPPRPSSHPSHHHTKAVVPPSSSSSPPIILHSKQQQAALDVVRNVFERFNRVVRDCTLRPPVTFIIFFLHELAQAPHTPYWRQLVDMMPVELVFALGRLDPSALPLGLFMRIYNPAEERHWAKCVQYALLVSRKCE